MINKSDKSMTVTFTSKLELNNIENQVENILIINNKSIQDKKMHFIKGDELKLTQIELLSFFIFKCVVFKKKAKKIKLIKKLHKIT